MDIRNQYQQFYKPKTYQVPKYYSNTQIKTTAFIKKKLIKRKTYIDQIVKMSKNTPGPSEYSPVNPQRNNDKQKFMVKIKGDKKNYLDQVIKRAKSVPDVGKYQIQTKNNKLQKQKMRYAILSKIQKQKYPIFKHSIFEAISRDTLNVSPGIYNSKIISSSPKYSIMPQHKKSKSLPKIPSPQEYNPVPSNFSTFDKISSVSRLKDQQCQVSTFGSRKKIKNLVNSPGPIYNLISQWCPKKYDRNSLNLFEVISKGVCSQQSIYR